MGIKKKIAQLIIARLAGRDINKNLNYYQSLVKKDIGGFIIFGGKLREVCAAIKKLQDSAEIPLFISSDLERGLGQQIEGGTLFPPPMAIAQAINQKDKKDLKLLRKTIDIIAKEAKAAGINVVFSPVLDVNTNPQNPIICTRAFSDDPKKVAWFGKEFIKGFQRGGLIACAKHFPGHGDTGEDSHIKLPVVKGDIKRLWDVELYPFRAAIKAGVKMIMIGHLKVPAIDSKFPSSLSEKTIRGVLRDKMGFKGLVITDAINMGAIKLREEEASYRAIKAGADLILHPCDPEKVIDYLASRWEEIMPRAEESFQRVIKAKKELSKGRGTRVKPAPSRSVGTRPGSQGIGKKSSWDLAYKLTRKSIKIKTFKEYPVILIIDDDDSKSGDVFGKTIKNYYPKVKTIYIDNKYKGNISAVFNSISNRILIAAVFSKISAGKGRSGLSVKLKDILKRAIRNSKHSIVIGFCSPYFLREISEESQADAYIEAYSDSEMAQKAVASVIT